MPLAQNISFSLKKIGESVRYAAFPADRPAPVIRRADGPLTHLRAYLDYYRSLRAPGFAVLVTGEWGIGKTHQVEHALDEDQFYYVSLYGLRSSEEVRAAVFAQMYPLMHKVKGFISDAKQAASDASGLFAFGSLAPGLLGAFFDQTVRADRILIFDDLERCSIEKSDLLGIINQYVEHSGCRVIVIAHDGKIADEAFKETKEKLFGQTIKVDPQVDQAFESFVNPYGGTEFGNFLEPLRKDVLDIFKRSQVASLRILRYLIEDLKRLFEAMDPEHLESREAVTEVVKMLSVFSIELRSGRIQPENLKDRPRDALNGEASKIAAISSRYQSIDLTSHTLQDAVLVQMLADGVYDTKSIRRSVAESRHFLVPEEASPWRTVINFDHLDDPVVEAAVVRMKSQLRSFQEMEPGEMLHIWSLRLMMAENKISAEDPDKVVSDAKSYFDYMLAQGRMPARTLSWEWSNERFEAFGGVAFWVSRAMKSRFQEIREHLKQNMEKALDAQLAMEAPALLDDLLNGKEFFEKLVSTYTGKNPYAYVPVLSKIDPEEFVQAWLNSPKEGWYWIGNTLAERHKRSFHTDALKVERSWLKEVVSLIEKETARFEGFRRFRLVRAIGPIASELKARDQDDSPDESALPDGADAQEAPSQTSS